VTEKDYAAQALLQWYVGEQVEEENSAQEIVSMLEIAGDSGSALLMVDRHLAARSAQAR
jgi:ferritin